MKKILLLLSVILSFAMVISLSSCEDDDDDDTPETYGKITFNFEHYIDGQPIEFDNMKYTNAAGNNYEVTNIQWFVSNITLHKKGGGVQVLNAWDLAHYIDTDIPKSMSWEVTDKVNVDDYQAISFTFGFRGGDNEPFMYVNYPESAMFWPLHLGGDSGGYHYMKLNGFWMNQQNLRSPFEFHLGVGQAQDANGNRIKNPDGSYVFVQNWFDVTLDQSSFSIADKGHKEVTIRMNVDNWFKNPNVYDHNAFGADIMENQAAQIVAKANGIDVFSLVEIKDVQ
jgi:hypothetical protein